MQEAGFRPAMLEAAERPAPEGDEVPGAQPADGGANYYAEQPRARCLSAFGRLYKRCIRVQQSRAGCFVTCAWHVRGSWACRTV